MISELRILMWTAGSFFYCYWQRRRIDGALLAVAFEARLHGVRPAGSMGRFWGLVPIPESSLARYPPPALISMTRSMLARLLALSKLLYGGGVLMSP
ncbi:hypothetical protein [Geodermatophilus sp. SYSU D00710]